MFYIRVDGNSDIGLGHLMRCLSIAEQVRDYKEQVTFIISDTCVIPILESRKYSYFVLDTDYRDMEAELPVLTAYLDAISAKRILIDSYYVTQNYFDCLRSKYKVAYIDDVNAFPYHVHLLINYNLYADQMPYEEEFVKDVRSTLGKHDVIRNIPKYLLGCDYVPLRKEFTQRSMRENRSTENILITMGGSDPFHLTDEFLMKAWANDSGIAEKHFMVVTTQYNTHLEQLQELEKTHANMKLYVNCNDMAGLMRQADLALTAGGSTVYELCAMGVPFVCFSFVENQDRIAEELGNRQIAINAGNYRIDGKQVLDRAISELGRMLTDHDLLLLYQQNEMKLVDGQGAERIAEQLFI